MTAGLGTPSPEAADVARIQELAATIRPQLGAQSDLVIARRYSPNRRSALAALEYIVWELEGELVRACHGDRTLPKSGAVRRELEVARQVRALFGSQALHDVESRRISARPVCPEPDQLVVRVLRAAAPQTFANALRRLLTADGLDGSFIVPSGEAGAGWAYRAGLLPPPDADVVQAYELDDRTFGDRMRADVDDPGVLPDHPLVAERRLLLGARVLVSLRRDIGMAEKKLARSQVHIRNQGALDGVRLAYERTAMFALRQAQARRLVEDGRRLARELMGTASYIQLRLGYLQHAAEDVAREEPELWQTVLSDVDRHQARCPDANEGIPCAECVPGLAAKVKSRISAFSVPFKPALDRPEAAVTTTPARQTERFGRRPEALCVAIAGATVEHSAVAGLAWISADGRAGATTGLADDADDAHLLALVQAIGGLPDDLRLDIRTHDAGLHQRVQDRLAAVRSPRALPVQWRLLTELDGPDPRVRVLTEPSPDPYGLNERAAQLASAALENVRRADRSLARRVAKATHPLRPREQTRPPVIKPGKAHRPQTAVPERHTMPQRWESILTGRDLTEGVLDVPDEIRHGLGRQLPQRSRIELVLTHRSAARVADTTHMPARLADNGHEVRLTHARWPADFFPGIVLACTWRQGDHRILARTERLNTTQLIAGELTVRYRYDHTTLVHEIAPGGPGDRPSPEMSTQRWLLRALTVLGYLVSYGCVVLTEADLTTNMINRLGFPSSREAEVPYAVQNLISMKRLTRVTGSLGHDGRPTYPAQPGLPRVRLISYRLIEELPAEPHGAHGQPYRPAVEHDVSGHLRRLPPGQHASAEAMERHREAVRAARLANRSALQDGYTYIRPHLRKPDI